MRALCWHGKGDVRVDTVADPEIKHPRDAIIKVTACAICGSDLHLLDGYQPTMEAGDILGHENMGEVVALGSEVTNLKIGDRVVAKVRVMELYPPKRRARFECICSVDGKPVLEGEAVLLVPARPAVTKVA